MSDVHSKEVRSYNMSRIRSKNTKPELIVRKCLFNKGFRYRLHDKKLPGKPDIILKKYKTVVFINGCFWHGHENCKYFKMPTTRKEWWYNKINNTKQRDKDNIEQLTLLGWNIIVIYECQLKKEIEETLNLLIKNIEKSIKA